MQVVFRVSHQTSRALRSQHRTQQQTLQTIQTLQTDERYRAEQSRHCTALFRLWFMQITIEMIYWNLKRNTNALVVKNRFPKRLVSFGEFLMNGFAIEIPILMKWTQIMCKSLKNRENKWKGI